MKQLLHLLPRPTTLLLILFGGILIGRCFTPMPETVESTAASADSPLEQEQQAEPEIWTCSMHPSVQMPTPGSCPICGMDLILLETGGGMSGDGPQTIRLEDGQKAIAGIRTTMVVRKEVAHSVQLVGKLTVNETALATLSAWVGGRLDRLYVDYTGLKVRAGDHMAEIYSPQLFHAQQELIVAVESARRFNGNLDESLQKIANSTVIAARKKLSLYGLSEEQQEQIIARGEPTEQITLTAPMGGTVIHRNAAEGQYVNEGDPLYTIANLDHLWLELDAYESDMPWLRYGQEVQFEVDAWPGEVFHGTISFLDPVLDPLTRTVHVRVEVENSEGRLRPEMYVRAKVMTMVMGSGQPANVDLSGKWMCPMHPQILEDEEGDCQICGMPLEPIRDLGYGREPEDALAPLVIPMTAPLLTGERAIVFVELPGQELHGASLFEARDVVLGPRAGDFFVVREGLTEGEVVVSRGSFTIDSELQLRGKPSMMAPGGGGGGGGHAGMPGMEGGQAPTEEMHSMLETPMKKEQASAAFRMANGRLILGITALGEALASDDLPQSQASLGHVKEVLTPLTKADIPAAAQSEITAMHQAITAAEKAVTLDSLRVEYEKLQAPMITLATRFGYLGVEREMAIFHCPMALGDGADWLDFKGDDTRNPYYGASMLACGEEVRPLPGFDEQK